MDFNDKTIKVLTRIAEALELIYKELHIMRDPIQSIDVITEILADMNEGAD